MITWRLERVRPRGVQPLEIWNLARGEDLLYEHLGTEGVERAEARGSSTDEIDARLFAAWRSMLEEVAGRGEPVFVGGGLLERSGLRNRIRDPRVAFSRTSRFVGLSGAHALAGDGALLLDLGQTALKLALLGDTRSHALLERPLAHLPRYPVERGGASARTSAEQSARLADWVSRALAAFLERWPTTRRELMLALPCALDDAGVPGPCTYPGWAGDSTYVIRLLSRVEALLPASHPWRDTEVRVRLLNDAELAACSARAEAAMRQERMLVVTLGFGPGAAWLAPS